MFEKKTKALAINDTSLIQKLRDEIAAVSEKLTNLSEEKRWIDLMSSGKRGDSIADILKKISAIDEKCGQQCKLKYSTALNHNDKMTSEDLSRAGVLALRSLQIIKATHSTHRQQPKAWVQMLHRICYVLDIAADRLTACQLLPSIDKEAIMQEGKMSIFMRGVVRILEVGLWVVASITEAVVVEAMEYVTRFRSQCDVFLRHATEWNLTFEVCVRSQPR